MLIQTPLPCSIWYPIAEDDSFIQHESEISSENSPKITLSLHGSCTSQYFVEELATMEAQDMSQQNPDTVNTTV